MSIQAVAWALNESPTYDPTSRLILVALAERADDKGRKSWPSIKTIAEKSAASESTIHRRLRELERNGIISRGDQNLNSHYDANRRPTVYDLNLNLQRTHVGETETDDRGVRLTPQDQGCQVEPSGVSNDASGVSNDASGVSESTFWGVTDDRQDVLKPSNRTFLKPPGETDVSPGENPDLSNRSKANRSTPEGYVADVLHIQTKGALSYPAMKPIVKWALDSHPDLSPESVGRTIDSMYRNNRGVTKQSLGVILQGYYQPGQQQKSFSRRREESNMNVLQKITQREQESNLRGLGK